jgi:hypothetical protein
MWAYYRGKNAKIKNKATPSTCFDFINPAAINLNYLLSFALFFGDGALPRNAPIR